MATEVYSGGISLFRAAVCAARALAFCTTRVSGIMMAFNEQVFILITGP